MVLMIWVLVLVFVGYPDAKTAASSPLEPEEHWCYSCVDMDSSQTWCRSGKQLLKAQRTIDRMTVIDRLMQGGLNGVQRCWKSAPYCVILDVLDADDTSRSQYRRGCSDGRDFSFQYPDATYFRLNATTDSRLTQFLPPRTRVPNNRTVCLWSQQSHVQACLAVCEGNFCNGPQDEESGRLSAGTAGAMSVQQNNRVRVVVGEVMMWVGGLVFIRWSQHSWII